MKTVGIVIVVVLVVFGVWFIAIQGGHFKGQGRIPAKLLVELRSVDATMTEFRSIQEARLKIVKNDAQLVQSMVDLIRRSTYGDEAAARRLLALCGRMAKELESLMTAGQFQIEQILAWQRNLEKMRLGAARSEIAKGLEEILTDAGLPKAQFRLSASSLRQIRSDIDRNIPSFNDRELRSGLATLGVIHDHALEIVRGFEQLEAHIEQQTSTLKDFNAKLP